MRKLILLLIASTLTIGCEALPPPDNHVTRCQRTVKHRPGLNYEDRQELFRNCQVPIRTIGSGTR